MSQESKQETKSDFTWSTGTEIAQAVAAGQTSALSVIDAALAVIAARNPTLNAFTTVTAERARAKAKAVDASPDKSKLPLAGVPFAVKNLFDIEGIVTVAGSKINRAYAPAKRDAELIERMEKAGAVLVGALNMGEYAYDFTGENVHDGPSRNPHDITRMTGGSSGGSGGAVGGGMVPIALGSDTNGSIRVPSSLCGIFGLKPTYGRLTRARSFPFVASLDHLGPFARSTRDLALSYDVMQGYDADDAGCADRPKESAAPFLERGLDGLRIAVAGGYFRKGASPEASSALDGVAKALNARTRSKFRKRRGPAPRPTSSPPPKARRLHLDRLRKQANDFDPAVRDRLHRRRHGAVDAGREGADFPPLVSRPGARAVQGLRCHSGAGDAGHRAASSASRLSRSTASRCRCAPIWASTRSRFRSSACRWWRCRWRSSRCRSRVQIIAAPWREDVALRIAYALEQMGAVEAPRPNF